MNIEEKLGNESGLLQAYLGKRKYAEFLENFIVNGIMNLSREEDIIAVETHFKEEKPVIIDIKLRDYDSSSALEGRGLMFTITSSVGENTFSSFAKIGGTRKGEAKRSARIIKVLNQANYPFSDEIVSIFPELEFMATPNAKGKNISKSLDELSKEGRDDFIINLTKESIELYDKTKPHHSLTKKLEKEKRDYLAGFKYFFKGSKEDVVNFYAKVDKKLKSMPPGLIHGDLNFDNIICEIEEGYAKNIKVVDWGGAKLGLPFEDIHRIFIGFGLYVLDYESFWKNLKKPLENTYTEEVKDEWQKNRNSLVIKDEYLYCKTKAWEYLKEILERNVDKFNNEKYQDQKDSDTLKTLFILNAAHQDLMLAGKTIQIYKKLSPENEHKKEVKEIAGMYLRRGLDNLEFLEDYEFEKNISEKIITKTYEFTQGLKAAGYNEFYIVAPQRSEVISSIDLHAWNMLQNALKKEQRIQRNNIKKATIATYAKLGFKRRTENIAKKISKGTAIVALLAGCFSLYKYGEKEYDRNLDYLIVHETRSNNKYLNANHDEEEPSEGTKKLIKVVERMHDHLQNKERIILDQKILIHFDMHYFDNVPFSEVHKNIKKYEPLVNQVCEKYRVDPDLVLAIISLSTNKAEESQNYIFSPMISREAIKEDDALILPGTEQRVLVSTFSDAMITENILKSNRTREIIRDPKKNIDYSVKYLKELKDKGRTNEEIMAYYLYGEEKVNEAKKHYARNNYSSAFNAVHERAAEQHQIGEWYHSLPDPENITRVITRFRKLQNYRTIRE